MALVGLLADVVARPHAYEDDKGLTAALSSQGALAGYSNSSLGILRVSLNAQKSIAEEILNRGFSELNELRVAAKRAVRSSVELNRSVRSGTRADLRTQLAAEREKVEQLRCDLLLLTWALKRVIVQARSYARESDKRQLIARCQKEQSELLLLIENRVRLVDKADS